MRLLVLNVYVATLFLGSGRVLIITWVTAVPHP